MTYNIKNHGSWTAYLPDASNANANAVPFPKGTIFCKRSSDDKDWYAYVRNPNTFAENSLKMCCYLVNGTLVVQVATFEAQRLFPQAMTVFELTGYSGTDPQSDFAQKVCDPDAGTFTPQAAPKARKIVMKADLWRRCTDNEVSMIMQGLEQKPLRIQKIFADAQYIDYDDENFSDFKAGFIAAFGADRTAILLAPSS